MRKLSPLVLFIVGLSACDEFDTELERAAVGAAVGCAAGETLVQGQCIEGAVIGGAVGALSDEF